MKKNIPYTMLHAQRSAILAILLILELGTFAQVSKDTARRPSVSITSSYKPVLRNAVKINFSAAQLNADSSKPVLNYTIPAQNLFYSYQPINLKPLALQMDTNLYLGMRNFIKAGFGNFATPFVSAGFSFGDGRKSLLSLQANYIASKGKIKYQDYSLMNLQAAGSFFSAKNEFYLGAGLHSYNYNLYGYDKILYPNYTRQQVQQPLQDIVLNAGLRNIAVGAFGISYDPNVEVSIFSNKDKLSESTLAVSAPVKKQFGDAFTISVEAKADITSYTTKNLSNNIKLNNNVFQVAPSLLFSTPRFTLNGGVIPTWDNGKFVWLPNIYGEARIQEKVFLIQAGFVGKYIKNTWRNLAAVNPYLLRVSVQNNTKETELYGGIKATAGKHLNFSAKAGIVGYNNLQLFVNDTSTDLKAFKVINEPKASNLRLHGDISYINQDKFTLTAGVTFNGYTGLQNNPRAWNTVPMEITGSLRWWAFKQVMLKCDLYAFGGGNYLAKNNTANSFGGGTDLSAGLEFKINKMFSAWLDINNLFNNKYQRWHNYEVYGLNLLGGVRVSF
jgi:hypothetical protein